MKASINALMQQIKSGKRLSDKARIVKFLRETPYSTLSTIEQKLGLLRSTSSARVSELMDIGLIEERGTQKRANGYETLFAVQTDPSKQARNALNRKKEKYQHWLKSGKTMFDDIMPFNVKKALETI